MYGARIAGESMVACRSRCLGSQTNILIWVRRWLAAVACWRRSGWMGSGKGELHAHRSAGLGHPGQWIWVVCTVKRCALMDKTGTGWESHGVDPMRIRTTRTFEAAPKREGRCGTRSETERHEGKEWGYVRTLTLQSYTPVAATSTAPQTAHRSLHGSYILRSEAALSRNTLDGLDFRCSEPQSV